MTSPYKLGFVTDWGWATKKDMEKNNFWMIGIWSSTLLPLRCRLQMATKVEKLDLFVIWASSREWTSFVSALHCGLVWLLVGVWPYEN